MQRGEQAAEDYPANLSQTYLELAEVLSDYSADEDALNQALTKFTETLEHHNTFPGKLVDARIGEFSRFLSANVGRISPYWTDRRVDLPIRPGPTM